MTLEQLRIFVAVAEREHVTRAARALNLTQSAVSSAISALEARYATQLFNRIGRRIELTQAGKLFLNEARAVLARAGAAETALADLAGMRRGQLAVAASQTVANYWLPPLMLHYRATHPGIALSLRIGNTENVAAWVHDGIADFGFVEGEIDNSALSIAPVGEDELVIVTSPALASARRRPLSASELGKMRWVFRERGSGTRAIFEAALAERGVDVSMLDVVLELPSNEAVRTAVEQGAGAAALSHLAVLEALQSGTLVALKLDLPKRQFFALRHRERWISRAEREFFAMIGRGETATPHAAARKRQT
jgi:DNA-binding transcriptional LysR family regulator